MTDPGWGQLAEWNRCRHQTDLDRCELLHQFPPMKDLHSTKKRYKEARALAFRHAEDLDDIAAALDARLLVLDADADIVQKLAASAHNNSQVNYLYTTRWNWVLGRDETTDCSARPVSLLIETVQPSPEQDTYDAMLLLGVEPLCIRCGQYRLEIKEESNAWYHVWHPVSGHAVVTQAITTCLHTITPHES